MPWKKQSIMDQRIEFAMLASLDGANVRALCRRFNVSADTAYRWLNRATSGAVNWAADRSRRPHHSPRRTAATVETAVLRWRDAHPAWGARKIAHCLARDGISPPAVSTIHAILARHDRIHPPPGGERATTRFEHADDSQRHSVSQAVAEKIQRVCLESLRGGAKARRHFDKEHSGIQVHNKDQRPFIGVVLALERQPRIMITTSAHRPASMKALAVTVSHKPRRWQGLTQLVR
ncbi:MAG: helix-turn-helix domain-containing protein [Rhodospirillaceae bacterium]|nr:helix-turn-helix domain-containing protein [Rhodospirillaceae bacterium]